MTKRIKILYTIPNFDTAGSGKVVYDLVKHIDKTRFEPHICCFHDRGAFFKEVKALDVPIHIFQFTANYRPFSSLLFRLFKIRRFFKTHQFDVIHSWHWSSDFTEPLASRLAGIPYVYTKKAMGWGNRSWQWRSKLSDKIIAINKDMVSQFFNKMADRVVQIPIGLNPNDFGILEKTYQNEDGFVVEKDDFVIVSIANLVPVKGIEILLDAVNEINDIKIKVFIVGDNTSHYAMALQDKYAGGNVVFTDKKQNIKSYLALSDVFVIPTKDIGEGQPIAPIEAMLSGRIVVGSDVSGIKDILKPFQEQLFTANSVSDLKQKLEYIMQMDSVTRNVLAKKMHDYTFKKYSIVDSIALHEGLYKSLIKSR